MRSRLATAGRTVVGRGGELRLLRGMEAGAHLILADERELVGAEEVVAVDAR
jgi:hypothetical protein